MLIERIPALDRLQAGWRAQPGGAVGVKLDRFTVGILEDQRNQRAGSLRREQSSRIFEADARHVEFGGLREFSGENNHRCVSAISNK